MMRAPGSRFIPQEADDLKTQHNPTKRVFLHIADRSWFSGSNGYYWTLEDNELET